MQCLSDVCVCNGPTSFLPDRPVYKIAKLSANHASSLFQRILSSKYEEWCQNRKRLPSFSTVRPTHSSLTAGPTVVGSMLTGGGVAADRSGVLHL